MSSTAVNRKLNGVILGLGHWGPNFVSSLEQISEVGELVGVEHSSTRCEIVRNRLPHLKIYPSLEEGLNKHKLDFTIIATPTNTHFELGMKSLNFGLHTFIEKPLATSIIECKALGEFAKEKGLTIMVGHIFIYNQAVIEAKAIIDRGDLGEILYLRSTRTNLGPIRADVNATWDLTSHDISIFNFLLNDRPMSVAQQAFSLLGGSKEDISSTVFTYESGVVGIAMSSWLDPIKKRELIVVGSKRMLVFDDMDVNQPLHIYDKGVFPDHKFYADKIEEFKYSIKDGGSKVVDVTTGKPLLNECQHFLDCILKNQASQTGSEFGTNIVACLEAIDRSHDKDGQRENVVYE